MIKVITEKLVYLAYLARYSKSTLIQIAADLHLFGLADVLDYRMAS